VKVGVEKESIVESSHICDGVAGSMTRILDASNIPLTDEMVERIVKRLHGAFQVQAVCELASSEGPSGLS
jgi:hypothetical protein